MLHVSLLEFQYDSLTRLYKMQAVFWSIRAKIFIYSNGGDSLKSITTNPFYQKKNYY